MALSRHRGGVALFYWDSPNFAVKEIRQFGANVIACQLETGKRRWYIVGFYLALGDGTMILDVEVAMAERPRGADLIVAGNFNMDLENIGSWGWDKDITTEVATEGLEDIVGNLLPQWRVWCKDRRAWEMVRQGRVVRSWTDYILVSNRRIFQNVAV